MRKIEGILVDIDGTLIDSNRALAQSWHEALTEGGIETTYHEVRDHLGLGSDNLLSRIGKLQVRSKEAQHIRDIRREIFHQRFLKTIKPFPFAQQLLEELGKEYKIMVVSTASEEDLVAVLKQTGLYQLVDGHFSGQQMSNGKANESILDAALAKMMLPASKVVMLCSTPFDIDTAVESGIRTIALACGGWKETDLQDAEAVYKDPETLLQALRKNNAHVLAIRGHRGISENI